MNLKENIMFIIRKRNMTQTSLAKKMGVTKSQIQSYLKGNATVNSLQKIATALDTTVETLVSESPLDFKNDAIPSRGNITATKLTCPHCGAEISLMAKE